MTASVEIVVWPATEAYINDHTLIDPAANHIGKSEGVLTLYTGVQTEEPNAYMVTVWDDIKSHQKVIANSELFASHITALQPTMSSPPTSIIHANFKSDYTPIFAAPVTEFALVTPKAGIDKVVTEAKLAAICVMAGATPGCKAVKGTWGPVVEKDNTYLLVLGWQTVEDHSEEVKTGPLTEPVKELLAENDIILTHAKLRIQAI